MPTLLYLAWLLWIENQHTLFGCQKISGLEDIQYIENNDLFFTQSTPAYDDVHPIKFGCKRIGSPADMVETVIFDQMSPHCDPELEDNQPICFHDTLTHDVASPYHVWLQKVKQLRRYRPDEHSLEFWTFSVTLTLTTTEQPNLFTRQSTLWWCTIKPSLVAKGSAVQITY